ATPGPWRASGSIAPRARTDSRRQLSSRGRFAERFGDGGGSEPDLPLPRPTLPEHLGHSLLRGRVRRIPRGAPQRVGGQEVLHWQGVLLGDFDDAGAGSGQPDGGVRLAGGPRTRRGRTVVGRGLGRQVRLGG